MLEKIERVSDRQVQDVRDGLSFISHLERFTIVPPSFADLAGHVHIGQEVHLDFHEPVALTGFAPPALHIEREPPRTVPAQFRLREIGK